MTAKQKAEMKKAVAKADETLAQDPQAVETAMANLGLKEEEVAAAAATEPAPKAPKTPKAPKAPKAVKEPKEKKLAVSAVKLDTTAYEQAFGKKPGTGKRDPNAVWRFSILGNVLEVATEFFRDAKAKAIEAAIEAKAELVQVVA